MNEWSAPSPEGFWSVAGSVNLLAGLDGNVREQLARSATRRIYPARTLIAGVDIPIDCVYIVESGRLRVSIPDERGEAIEVARLGPGEYCGELSLVRSEHSGARVEALTDSVVWAIPHRVLARAVEQSPALMRELATTIASRLNDANQRLKRLSGRGRLVGVVSLGCPDRTTPLMAHSALAASRMLGRPTLLVDLTEGAATPSFARELPSLRDLALQPGMLATHEAFASTHGPQLGVARRGAGRELPRAALVDLLAALTARYPLVVVHVAPESEARAVVAQVADADIAIGGEHDVDAIRRTRLVDERDVIVIGDRSGIGTEGDRRRLAERCRANVLRVVPGPVLPLVRDGARDGAREGDEPWRSVDWLARHFLQRKIGLALGAGGAKGYAHLGVLAALAEHGIEVDALAGTSIGAPLASGLALRMTIDEMRRHMDGLFRQLARPRLPWSSVWSSGPLRRGFEDLCSGRAFEDLTVPLSIVAADLDRREEFIFSAGPLSDAIVASIAIPVVYPPVELYGRRLVDGGVLNPVPTNTLARVGADIVIGVKLAPPAAPPSHAGGWWGRLRPPILDTVLRAFDVMQWKITEQGAARADVTIEPLFGGSAGLRDWGRAEEFMDAGRAATEAVMPALRARLGVADAGTPERLAA